MAAGASLNTAAVPSPTTAQEPYTSKAYKFDGKVAWQYLLKQVSFGPRVPGSDAQIKCRDWMIEELKKGCDDVHVQHLTHHWTYKNKDLDIYNVIGSQNWKESPIHVLLLAHWDSRPVADMDPNQANHDTPIPGADDGASGVGVLLELAQAIKDRHPGVGVMYLLDDGEDLGPQIEEMLLGVDYFADHLPDPKPDYGILLDMIGQTGLSVPEERNSYFQAQNLTRAFYANANKIGLGDVFPQELGEEIEDDHLPLLAKGIPTLDLIDFDYPQWHTLDDTPIHCSEKSLQETGVALESFLLRDHPFKPESVKGDK